MLRIKSPAHSIPFYRDYFGMTLVREVCVRDFIYVMHFMTAAARSMRCCLPGPLRRLIGLGAARRRLSG